MDVLAQWTEGAEVQLHEFSWKLKPDGEEKNTQLHYTTETLVLANC